jgi:hypothetical protein
VVRSKSRVVQPLRQQVSIDGSLTQLYQSAVLLANHREIHAPAQPFEELIGPYLPVLTQTVLLPFKDVIV